MPLKPNDDKPIITSLATTLGRLPADKRRAAMEMSASLAGVSLRLSRAFVEALPEAAKILSADDIRAWGEMGRRLGMGNSPAGAKFFAAGINDLKRVPENGHFLVFQICTRQLILSSSMALETFRRIPSIADEVDDDKLFVEFLRLALEVANRSAKHGAEFLQKTPRIAHALQSFGGEKSKVVASVLDLAELFVNRTGGMTVDLLETLPAAIEKLDAKKAVLLINRSAHFLEFGGSVTLHFISAGSEVLHRIEAAFEVWCDLLWNVSRHGNAVLIALLRATPKFFAEVAFLHKKNVLKVLQLINKVADQDAESALAALSSSPSALQKVSLTQFEEWIEAGLKTKEGDSQKARRSYFALETRGSNALLQETHGGLPLEKVKTVLRMYSEGLTGKTVEVEPLSAMPQESRIGDGKTIYLPSIVSAFGNDEMDFQLYKVLAAHGAGQIEFGTFERDTTELKAAFAELSRFYNASPNDLDAFSLSGYIEGQNLHEQAAIPDANMPSGSDYRAVLETFPEPGLAKKIFVTMENARIDYRLRQSYRGLRRDLDLTQSFMRKQRPYIFDLPMHQVPFELLFQITLCGGATDDARQFYGQIVSEIETVVESYFHRRDAGKRKGEGEKGRGGDVKSSPELANSPLLTFSPSPFLSLGLGGENTVADSLMATSRVYNLFQNISSEQMLEDRQEQDDKSGENAYTEQGSQESAIEEKLKQQEAARKVPDIRELFNAWNSLNEEGDADDLHGSEAWTRQETPEQNLEAEDIAFSYDEWDRELNDYRVGWSRVIEKKVKKGDRNFVELARSRYRGVISSIRHQFQMMKPENLTRINRELDGEDYDLNALVDFVIDRKADGRQSEKIYTKRLRKQRDVAVSILLDQSSSTARTITRNPLQPYTHPGRRIIEIEKEGLVLMSEALEAVGDVYSINGFTSEGRRNVKFYVVKDFGEKYSDEVERRIGGISFQNNTRLGAAIRHASAKLLRQDARTKLLIILTDGRPYDHDYGDARYAREDVREALTEAKITGITPFCITIDRESEAELKDLYGDIGYTIIDDVLSLPERMPNIYRRLTS